MFFVHPQIEVNEKNLNKVWRGFFGKLNSAELKKRLEKFFPGKKIIFTDMARSAFKMIIEKFKLQGSIMMMPAFICDIFYPIIKEYDIKPIFLDIDTSTFHPRIEEIKKKKNSEVKAIMLSHTYGLPMNIGKVKEVFSGADPKPVIIEDCAHAFAADLGDYYVGNTGEVAFFSLYKQLPCFRGGMVVCPKDWQIKELPKTRFSPRDFISFLNSFSLFAFIFKSFGNKVAPHFVRKEKMPEPAGSNEVSLKFFQNFFDEQQENLSHRIELGKIFQKELKGLGFQIQKPEDNVFCYLSGLIPAKLEHKRDRLVERLRERGVFCTRIWHTPIVMNPEVQKEYHLDLNEFPKTVEAANRVINFPLQNYYQKEDIDEMISAIERTLKDISGKKVK